MYANVDWQWQLRSLFGKLSGVGHEAVILVHVQARTRLGHEFELAFTGMPKPLFTLAVDSSLRKIGEPNTRAAVRSAGFAW